MRDRLQLLSDRLPDIPQGAIKRATERRGGGPPVPHKRALEIARRLREIDVLVQGSESLADMDEIIAEYMMLESQLFGLGPGAGD
jgi:hypothetical protein